MENHFELNDAEFERQFGFCELNPAIFSHEAHLRLTWIHLTQYGIEQATSNIQEQLVQFVKHVGAVDKYNKELTITAINAIYQLINQSSSTDFQEFIAEFPKLKTNFMETIHNQKNTIS